tara:strand:- start:57 stop:719 length:663 start_codon:yes stop_codon:yes gene_type:complete
MDVSYRLPQNFIPFINDFANRYALEDINNPQVNKNQLLTGIETVNLCWENIKLDKTIKNLEEPNAKEKEELSIMLVDKCTETIKNEFVNLFKDYTFSDVVIISSIETGRMLAKKCHKEQIKLIHTFHEDRDREDQAKKAFSLIDSKVKATTLHSFIGYESPLIIYLLESGKPNNVYTALTRLRMGYKDKCCYFKVLCADQKYFEYGETWKPKEGENWLTV